MERTKNKKTRKELTKEQWIVERCIEQKIPVLLITAEELTSVEFLRHYAYKGKIIGYSMDWLESMNKLVRKFEKWQERDRNQDKLKRRL